MEELKINREKSFKEYAQARLDFEKSAGRHGYSDSEQELGHAKVCEDMLKNSGLWESFQKWFQNHPEYHSDFDRLEQALQEQFPGHPVERDYEWDGGMRIGLTPDHEKTGFRTMAESIRQMLCDTDKVGYLVVDRISGQTDAAIKGSWNGTFVDRVYTQEECREKYPEIAKTIDQLKEVWGKTFPDYVLIHNIAEKAGVNVSLEYAEKDELGRTKSLVLQSPSDYLVRIRIDLDTREVTLTDYKGNEITGYNPMVNHPMVNRIYEAARDEMSGFTREEKKENVPYRMNIHPQVIIDSALEKFTERHPELPQPLNVSTEFSFTPGNEDKQNEISFFLGRDVGGVQCYLADGSVAHIWGVVKDDEYLTGEELKKSLRPVKDYALAMSECIKSAISKLCFTRDENIKSTYDQAVSIAEQVRERVKEHHSWVEPFVRFNEDYHMELVMETALSGTRHGAVHVDMETGEVWAEKDGEIMSEFDRTMKYQQLDQVLNDTLDILTHEEDRGNGMENELGIEVQEDHEEDADIAD